MALLFESVPCSRCGGSGKYSWCQMYGDTCFKCHGAGETLTKRGRAAQAYLDSLRKLPAHTLALGTYIECEIYAPSGAGARYFAPITEIKRARPGSLISNGVDVSGDMLEITTHHAKYGGMVRTLNRETMVRVGFSKADKQAQRDAALAYQDTLTKAGTPRKRGKAK